MPAITSRQNPQGAAGKRRSLWPAAIAIVVLLAGLAVYHLRYDLRSYAVLTHVIDPQASGPLLRLETRAVATEDVSIPAPSGPIRARLYLPAGIAHPHGMVVVPGIHYLGIEEPRLIAFARAIASSGLAVLTPQMDALADYHVDASSIPAIGESARWLQDRLGTGPVTVTGISFAGGLSLFAACDPQYAPHIRALVLIGPYDDLARVSRFLATNQEEFPDGRSIPYVADDYGPSVFVYAHLAQFFPAADLPAAHEALREWLWEHPEKARPWIARLSAPSQATMEALIDDRIESVRPQMLAAIAADAPELEALSPHGHIAGLRLPVFILHGAADDVIPPAESLWLEREVPKQDLRAVLISEVFSHVDPQKHASWLAEIRLVRFLAAVLRAAD